MNKAYCAIWKIVVYNEFILVNEGNKKGELIHGIHDCPASIYKSIPNHDGRTATRIWISDARRITEGIQ